MYLKQTTRNTYFLSVLAFPDKNNKIRTQMLSPGSRHQNNFQTVSETKWSWLSYVPQSLCEKEGRREFWALCNRTVLHVITHSTCNTSLWNITLFLQVSFRDKFWTSLILVQSVTNKKWQRTFQSNFKLLYLVTWEYPGS